MNNKNMEIKDLTWNEISSTRFNNPLFPESICNILIGKSKTQFVKSGSGLFNKAVSNLPFELHLPGHNFTGPELS